MSIKIKKFTLIIISAFTALSLSACNIPAVSGEPENVSTVKNQEPFTASEPFSSSNSDVYKDTQSENNFQTVHNDHSGAAVVQETTVSRANDAAQSQVPSATTTASARSSTANLSKTNSMSASNGFTSKPTVRVPVVTTKSTSTKPHTTKTASPASSSETTNREQAILLLVNQERAKRGLSALVLDDAVSKAAQIRAREIIAEFSHTRPDGTSCFTALDEVGIISSKVNRAENIASGQRSPEEVMQSWMNSDGHRANILNPNVKKLGVGYAEGGQYRTNWVQMFTS